MAIQKREAFDADKFLDSYEENAKMAGLTTSGANHDTRQTKQEMKVRQMPTLAKRDSAYLEQFLLQNKYNGVRQSGKQVFISNDFKKRIQRLVLFFSDGGSITGYVNKVLEQHFKDYEDVITKLNDMIEL